MVPSVEVSFRYLNGRDMAMGRHSVVRGEKSSYGQANGSSGTEGYEAKHLKEETTQLTDRGTATDSRLRTGGWLNKK